MVRRVRGYHKDLSMPGLVDGEPFSLTHTWRVQGTDKNTGFATAYLHGKTEVLGIV